MSKTTGVEWGGRGVEWGGRGHQLRGAATPRAATSSRGNSLALSVASQPELDRAEALACAGASCRAEVACPRPGDWADSTRLTPLSGRRFPITG